MTVAELIAELQKFHPDQEVVVPADSENGPILTEPTVVVALNLHRPVVIGADVVLHEGGWLY